MTAREIAFEVVRDVFPAPESRAVERSAQASLDYRARKADASARDRAFAAELAYGTIKMRRTLDWYLEPFVGDRRQPLPVAIVDILRLAFYELLYTQADVHATVFEFVNLAKRYGHRGLGNLVNAVLRGVLRDRPAEPARASFDSDEEYLATRYSLPTWLVRQWQNVFGERTEAICAAVDEPAQSGIVVNTLKQTPADVARQLQNAGIAARPSAFVPEALIVDRASPSLKSASLVSLEEAADGAWWLQSESSAMPVGVLNAQLGEAILDVCSGRGNKALQIGTQLAGEGTLLCVERDARKVTVLTHRLERAGIVAGVITGDATAELLQPDQRFDRILVDAPCSGTGIVGRHPEARWKKQGTDGERLAVTQRALLEHAARHVYPGGVLVYAVCSTELRETTEVMQWFLSRENFERGLIPAAYESLLTDDGDVLVPPGIDGRDGFYIARVERRS